MFNFFKKKPLVHIKYYENDTIDIIITKNRVAKVTNFIYSLTMGILTPKVIETLNNKQDNLYKDVLYSFSNMYLDHHNSKKPLIEPLNALQKNVK